MSPNHVTLFEDFGKFLSGEFVCRKCGKAWFSELRFGFGRFICPRCYSGEQPWLWLDLTSFWNRLLTILEADR